MPINFRTKQISTNARLLVLNPTGPPTEFKINSDYYFYLVNAMEENKIKIMEMYFIEESIYHLLLFVFLFVLLLDVFLDNNLTDN